MSEKLAAAVREALEKAPCSDRALALAAGVSQSMIWRIRNENRGCSPEVAAAVADALADWAEGCQEAEAEIRRAIERENGRE